MRFNILFRKILKVKIALVTLDLFVLNDYLFSILKNYNLLFFSSEVFIFCTVTLNLNSIFFKDQEVLHGSSVIRVYQNVVISALHLL